MLKGNRYLQIGLAITGVVTALAVLGLFWTPYDPTAMNMWEKKSFFIFTQKIILQDAQNRPVVFRKDIRSLCKKAL